MISDQKKNKHFRQVVREIIQYPHFPVTKCRRNSKNMLTTLRRRGLVGKTVALAADGHGFESSV